MTHIPSPARGTRGMVTAPTALASQSALAVLREGGNAVEAMIAAAASIAVVYPHMNSIGGDGFWLIARPGEAPRGLEACGAAAAGATQALYRERGLDRIPFRGGSAANTVAGTISGWEAAHAWSREALGGRMPLARLLADAIHYARDGIPVTRSQTLCTAAKREELRGISGFAQAFLPDGEAPVTGARFRQPRIAATLEQLARAGLSDFYLGDLARSMARDLQAAGSPLALADLQAHQAVWKTPLSMTHSLGTLYNMVGFQTKLKHGEQKRIFRTIPGLENAEFARLGGLHRNTYINSPRLLDGELRLKTDPRIRFAGQITGCEGYVESAAVGLVVGRIAAGERLGLPFAAPPTTTALGALIGHLTGGHIETIDAGPRSFQPMNVNFGLFPPLTEAIKSTDGKRLRGADKAAARKRALTARAKADLEAWLAGAQAKAAE